MTVDMAPRGRARLRRFGAIFYDTLLLFSVLYFATIPVVALNRGDTIPAQSPWYMAYLVLVSFLYFGWFWTHGGQTLGMKAWRVQVLSRSGGPVDWAQASFRYAGAVGSWAALGAGFLWALLRRDGQGWHDHLSNTVLVVVPRSL